MLDFYADWCMSCKEMEHFTFSDPAVQARLAGALLLKADVTANSAEDRELLQAQEALRPPGTIFFDPRAARWKARASSAFRTPNSSPPPCSAGL